MPRTEPRDGRAIVALIEVVAGLLPFREVHQHPQAVLNDAQVGRRRFAPQRAIVQLDPFEPANALLGAEVNPAGAEQLPQHVGNLVPPLRQPQCGELHREPVAVAVDHHAREEVGLAERDAVPGLRAR